MLTRKTITRGLALMAAMLVLTFVAAACGGDEEKAVIKFHDGQWETVQLHNAIAMYIVDNGYGYPTEEIHGTTGTMLVALPGGDLDVNMEVWRQNIIDWYDENIAAGKIVDLSGTGENVPNGSKGQILEQSAQGIYVPTFFIEQNPGLKSVLDLPKYKDEFADPEDPSKGILVNCIIGWACQKIVRAKWHAYGLYSDINIIEPGSAGAIDAAIKSSYDAGEPFVSYYWEPTKIVSELDLTRLEEPEWNQECQAALDKAVTEGPYESTIGCAFPVSDVHTGVHSSLVERAPEVTEFLSKVFIGALTLDELTGWRNDNEKEPADAGIYWLKNNEATWKAWVSDDIAKKVNKALEDESI